MPKRSWGALLVLCLLLCPPAELGSRTEEGPFWQATGGPEAGDIRAIGFDRDGRVFVGVDGGALFRSTDQGQSWQPASTGLASIRHAHIEAIVGAPNGDLFVAGPGDFTGILRSVDHGDHWTQVVNPQGAFDVLCLAFAPNGHLFAGTSVGTILRSRDGGLAWETLQLSAVPKVVSSLTVDGGGTLLAGVGHLYADYGWSLWLSSDNGETWAEKASGPEHGGVRVAANPLGGFMAAVFRTGILFSDDGLTWGPVGAPPNAEVSALLFDAAGTAILGSGSGVHRSVDRGATWTEWNDGFTVVRLWVQALGISQAGDVFAGLGFGSGMFRRAHGSDAWSQINGGLTGAVVLGLAVGPNDILYAGTGGSGAFRSADRGLTWQPINEGLDYPDVRSVAVDPVSGVVYAGGPFGLYRSTDGGGQWTKTSLPDIWVQALTSDAAGRAYAGGAWGGGVYRSIDSGATWTPLPTGLTDADIRALVCHPDGFVFAGTAGGVFRAASDADDWTPVNVGLPNLQISTLATGPSGTLYAGTTGNGVWRSTDHGDTWIQDAPGWVPGHVVALAIDSEEHLFVAADGGIFRSADRGATWTDVTSGVEGLGHQCLTADAQDYLYLATFGRSVFRTALPTVDTTTVAIDIRPGDARNVINPGSHGVIPVAVLSAGGFEAATVDPATVRFGRTGTEASASLVHLRDIDHDGDRDLVVHVRTQETGIRCDDTSAVLTGRTRAGRAFRGTDLVTTVGCHTFTATIDIAPGDPQNRINPNSHGVVQVALLTTDTLNAASVLPASIRFGGQRATAVPVATWYRDVDRDGDRDAVYAFWIPATRIRCGDTSAALTGRTRARDRIEGSGPVATIGCRH